jgi:plastocyanin
MIHRFMRRPIRLPLAVCALLLPLAGCGSSKPLPVLNNTIGLKLYEYRIRPQSVSATAGRLRLIVRNHGILTHNIAVETIPKNPNDKAQTLARTATVHAGQRAETFFTIAPGRYRLVCTIANHSYLGMTATLVVRR